MSELTEMWGGYAHHNEQFSSNNTHRARRGVERVHGSTGPRVQSKTAVVIPLGGTLAAVGVAGTDALW
ncbi:hypothetical protein, partial [Rubrivirga sp.]|uniref:hypothetical protein n=1 Tax=Rubrivirga sp. TaxID=1885344 RepID=UPI003C776550